MFTAFMNLTIFFLIYLLYRYIKSRIYDYLDKEPVSSRREWLILPVALFMFAFVATSGFTRYNVSNDSISIPFALHPFHIIPFKEIYLNWQNYDFYNAIYGQSRAFYYTDFINIKDYIRIFTSMLALGFSISIVNKTFVKSLLAMIFIRTLLGFMIGESYFATSLCLSLIAFLVAFLVYKILYRGIVRKNFLATFANSPVHRSFVVGYLIVMCLLPLYFVEVDKRWASDQWTMSEYSDFKEPAVLKTYDDKVELTPKDFRINNKENVEVSFAFSQPPVLDIPYKTAIRSIEFKFNLSGETLNYGTGINAGDDHVQIHLDKIINPYDKDRIKTIYPIELYGIEAINYVIDDKRFTNMLKVIESKWWTNENGYDCYTYTYQVPKVDGYEVNVGTSVTFDNPNPNKPLGTYQDKAWASVLDPVKIGSNEKYDIFSVDNYFYDYEMGPLKKSQIVGLDQAFFSANVRVSAKALPKEPIWTIDSIDYFKPYLE